MNILQIKQKILALDKKKKIKFIILFGSVAKAKQTPLSNLDLEVYYDGTPKERFQFRVTVSGNLSDKIDLHIFQDLPLTVQKEVITGKIMYYQNYQFLFDEVMKVIKEYEFFEKYLNEYYAVLDGESIGA